MSKESQTKDIQEAEIIQEETGMSSLKKFDVAKSELLQMAKDYGNLIVTDETMLEAKKARVAIREKRYDIQNILDFNKKILNAVKKNQESDANELLQIILPTEEKIDAGIKAIENRKAEEKAKAEREERERLLKEEAERRAEAEAKLKAEAERLHQIKLEQEAKEREIKKAQEAAELEIKRKQDEAQAEFEKREEENKKREADLLARELAYQKQVEAELERKRRENEAEQARLKAEKKKIDDEAAAVLEAVLKEKIKLSEEKAKVEEAKLRFRLSELTGVSWGVREATFDGSIVITGEELISLSDEEFKKIRDTHNAKVDGIFLRARLLSEKTAREAVEAETKRLEQLKPDKEKLLTFAKGCTQVVIPVLKDRKADMILQEAVKKLMEVDSYIKTEVARLK